MKFAAPDPGELAAWYRDHLGFPKCAVFGDGDYAIVRRGKLCLHFWPCNDRKIAENTACYTQIDSIEHLDMLHAEWLEASGQPGFAPGRLEDTPKDQHGHGMREFHVWDPAGNLIGLGAELES